MLKSFITKTIEVITYGFIFIFLSVSGLLAQNVQVDASLDTNKILLGDQINLNLNILQSEKANVLFPDIQKELPKEIEIIDFGKRDTTILDEQNRIRISQQYRITSFDSGKVFIPSFNFKYEINGKLDSVMTFPESLVVQTVSVDTTQTIFDIKAPFGAPISFRELLPYLGGLVALVLIVLAIIYYLKYRKRKQTGEEVVKKPSEPAHIIAIRELDKLKNEKLWQEGKIKLYYTRLTDIMRTYLWLRYDIKTLERTTDEILQSLRNTGFDNEELFEKLERALHLADLVKFAKWKPEATENEQNLQIAYEFVNKTKIEEKTKETNNNGENPEKITQSTNDKKNNA